MEWKDWIGKYVFIRTKHEKVYSGKIIEIDSSKSSLIWISMIDKYGSRVMFSTEEIVEIKEEEER